LQVLWNSLIFHFAKVIDKLSSGAVHVAGTKGKGSTCAFVESIIRHHGRKTGLYTSPHLITIRERFKIDGKSVSEHMFAHYFWWCWDRILATKVDQQTVFTSGGNIIY